MGGLESAIPRERSGKRRKPDALDLVGCQRVENLGRVVCGSRTLVDLDLHPRTPTLRTLDLEALVHVLENAVLDVSSARGDYRAVGANECGICTGELSGEIFNMEPPRTPAFAGKFAWMDPRRPVGRVGIRLERSDKVRECVRALVCGRVAVDSDCPIARAIDRAEHFQDGTSLSRNALCRERERICDVVLFGAAHSGFLHCRESDNSSRRSETRASPDSIKRVTGWFSKSGESADGIRISTVVLHDGHSKRERVRKLCPGAPANLSQSSNVGANGFAPFTSASPYNRALVDASPTNPTDVIS